MYFGKKIRCVPYTSSQLLAVLAGCDLVYLVTMLLESIRKFGLETRCGSNHLLLVLLFLLPRLHLLLIPNLLFPLNAISMMASVYMTLALAVERLTHSMREDISFHAAPKVFKLETLECCKNPPSKVSGCVQTVGLQQDGHRRQFSSQVECFKL